MIQSPVATTTTTPSKSPSPPKNQPIFSLISFADTYAGPQALFSSQATRALGDSKYDKRKFGALEVEAYVKALILEQKRSNIPGNEGVAKACRRLANDFVLSTDPNKRKGGMIGFAAVAIGLGSEVGKYLELLLPAVLKCFEDPEAKVRYFATEAMFNIAKVSRSALLRPSPSRFNPIFHCLCKVSTDVDAEVKHGALLLDRQLKSIVSESSPGEFDLDSAVELFHQYLSVRNPFVRQLLLSWIVHLKSVPGLLVMRKLPQLLDGLLDMLSDGNKSIRDSVELCLSSFLEEITQGVVLSTVDNFEDALLLLKTIVGICLVRRSDVNIKAVRLTCLHWLSQFVHSFASLLHHLFFEFLQAVLDSLQEEGEDARVLALELEQNLLTFTALEEVDEENMLQVCMDNLPRTNELGRKCCLQWIARLMDLQQLKRQAKDRSLLLSLLVNALQDPNDELVLLSLAASARVARNAGSNAELLTLLLDKFEADDNGNHHAFVMLEHRGAFIVRRLCVLLQPAPVYLGLASLLLTRKLSFVSFMVQTLNAILLTSAELIPLREVLKTNVDIFDPLFKAWCHNPVSALCVTLLSGSYVLAGRLMDVLGQVEVTVDLLMDADRLIRLLESPVFLHVRMDLLRSAHEFQPELLKALYGLLMILPQKSEAFQMLEKRLTAVTSMHIALNGHVRSSSSGGRERIGVEEASRYSRLCSTFSMVQDLHRQQNVEDVLHQSLDHL